MLMVDVTGTSMARSSSRLSLPIIRTRSSSCSAYSIPARSSILLKTSHSAGGPVLVEDWFDHENVTAVIAAHYPGQESGDAIASVLFGDVSPSGKMPYTTAHSVDDYPVRLRVAEASLRSY